MNLQLLDKDHQVHAVRALWQVLPEERVARLVFAYAEIAPFGRSTEPSWWLHAPRRVYRAAKTMTLIRHAESLANAGQMCVDPSLTDEGVRQAARLRGTYQLVICSPMRRAVQTWERSSLRARRFVVTDLVRECAAPSIDFKSELENENAQLLRPDADSLREGETVGENRQEYERRLDLFLAFLRAQPESSIAIVSHNSFLCDLLLHIRNACRRQRHGFELELVAKSFRNAETRRLHNVPLHKCR
jgi:broad specificity phosphatase PhoE